MKKNKSRSTPAIVHAGITIREKRPGYYMVDFMRDGKRERHCFRDLDKAKGYCDKQKLAMRYHGSSALDLRPADRSDAKEALGLLGGKVTLTAAAQFWIRHNGTQGGMTMQELGDRWQIALRAQGCRETTLREREHKVERLAKVMGTRTVASITRDDLIDWMDGHKLKGSTRDGYRRCYRAMFQYAVEERLIEMNPAAGIKPMRMDERLPTPFSVEQVQAVMQTAEKYAPLMVPTLAIQFFGGLRPGEALGLDWKAIDLRQKIIRVTPETSKVRRSRLVEINPALIAWLAPYKRQSGPIGVETQNQFDYYMTRKPIGAAYEQEGIPISERPEDKRPRGICAAADVEWIQDGPRKTFATMHYATYQDAGKLGAVLGHTSGADVLYRHYRGLATKAEARRYWSKIRPATIGKIIEMKKAVNQ